MKRLLLSAAIGAMMTTSALADAHSGAMTTYQSSETGDLYASELIGMRIYSAEQEFDSFTADTVLQDDAEMNWDDIGEVNDVILGRDGAVKAVILGVGGFLGIGEKDVAVDMKSIKIVNENDDPGDFFLVVSTNKDALTEAPTYERQRDAEISDTAATTETTAAQTGTAAATADRPILRTPQVEREGYEAATVDQLTTEDMTGARIYGANDDDIGEIHELILDDGGKLKEAVLDIGGFLGLGEHQIAVSMDELQVLRNQDGGDVRVYIDATKEELEAQPQHEG